MLQPQLDDPARSDAAEAAPGFALKSVLVFVLAGASWHSPLPSPSRFGCGVFRQRLNVPDTG